MGQRRITPSPSKISPLTVHTYRVPGSGIPDTACGHIGAPAAPFSQMLEPRAG